MFICVACDVLDTTGACCLHLEEPLAMRVQGIGQISGPMCCGALLISFAATSESPQHPLY